MQDSVAEAAIWGRLEAVLLEASWMQQTGDFPNGGPLYRQDPLDLELWSMMTEAFGRYRNRRMG